MTCPSWKLVFSFLEKEEKKGGRKKGKTPWLIHYLSGKAAIISIGRQVIENPAISLPQISVASFTLPISQRGAANLLLPIVAVAGCPACIWRAGDLMCAPLEGAPPVAVWGAGGSRLVLGSAESPLAQPWRENGTYWHSGLLLSPQKDKTLPSQGASVISTRECCWHQGCCGW